MSERAALDSYIETLQILAREGDTDRTDAERERDAAKLAERETHEAYQAACDRAAVAESKLARLTDAALTLVEEAKP